RPGRLAWAPGLAPHHDAARPAPAIHAIGDAPARAPRPAGRRADGRRAGTRRARAGEAPAGRRPEARPGHARFFTWTFARSSTTVRMPEWSSPPRPCARAVLNSSRTTAVVGRGTPRARAASSISPRSL